MDAAEPETGPDDTSGEDNTAAQAQAGAPAGTTGGAASAPAAAQSASEAGDVGDAAASSGEAQAQAAETGETDTDDGDAGATTVGDAAQAGPQAEATADGAAASGMQTQASPDAAAAGNGSAPDAEALQREQAQGEQSEEQHDNERVSQQASTERDEDQAEEDAQSGDAPVGAEAELSGPEKAAALESVGEEQPGEAGAGGGTGGGGGAGGGAEAETDEAPPDVSAMPPEQGLATLASATPAQADAALGGVQAAAAIHQQRQTQATQESLPQTTVGEPPSPRVTGSSGGGAGGAASANVAAPGSAAQAPKTEIAPTPEPPAGNAADKVARPNIAIPAQGAEPSAADRAKVAASISALPTSDPGLRTTLGAAPTLQLSGAADPAQMAAQKERSAQSIEAARARDAAEVAKPMGEQNVRPTVGQSQIRARMLKAAAGGAAGGAGAGAGAGGGSAGAAGGARGVLAEELQGPEVRAAMAAAAAGAATARAETQARIAAGNAAAQARIGDIKTRAANDQDSARAKARVDAQNARTAYARKQEAAIVKLDRDQQKTITSTTDKASEEKRKGEEDAAAQIAQGETQTADKAQEVETAVTEKKQEVQAKSEEKGFFGRLADKLGDWFDRQKQWISDKVEAGKKWIKDTADRFKKYAAEKIDQARDRVSGLIQAGGELLKSGADAVLSEFPAARDAVKGAIDSGVERGVKATNAIAQGAKTAVNKAVDTAAAVADTALDLGGKAANAVIDGAKATTVGALNAADKAMAALGVLKILVEDVASDPVGWIGKLGSSAKDGVVNHLAAAMKAAIKQWWEGKLETVLGIGPAIWAVLKKGGLALKEIGAMAWTAIKAAIPPALIQLVIEKVVAMIIPAAGAVIAIIEGLQAAWSSVSAMLGAIGKAIAYLKAVKGGGAGAQFAQLVAAAAVVVIDFVSNWLIARLGKAIMKIGGKIKGIAQKLLKKISGSVKKFKTRRKARKKRRNKAARDRKARQLRAQRKNRKADKDGKKKDDPNKKKQDKERKKQQRLDKAMKAIRPKLHALLRRGVSKLRLNVQLGIWRVRHRLSSLRLSGEQIVAKVNPTATEKIEKIPPSELGRALQGIMASVEAEFFRHLATARPAQAQKDMQEAQKAVSGGTEDRLDLPANDQVDLIRKILKGEVPMPAGKPKRNKPDELRSPLVRPGGKGFSIYVNPGPTGKPNAAGLYVPGAPDYPFKENTMNTPSGRGLATVVEPARIGGQFAAQQMGETMKDMGIATQEDLTGDPSKREPKPRTGDPKPAPLPAASSTSEQLAREKDRGRAADLGAPTVTGSARVADQDAGRPTAGGKIAQGQTEDAAAREHAQSAFRNMFVTLSQALDNPKVELFADAGKQQALKRVAEAFRSWATKAFRLDGKAFSPGEVGRLTAELKARLLVFLRTIK